MKKFLIVFCLSIYAILSAQNQVVTIPHQDAFDQYWKLVDEDITDQEAYQEWIPHQEKPENWTKSFGIQRYQLKEDYDLNHFYNLFISTLSKDFEENNHKLNHEIISQDKDHLTFMWWSDDKGYEISREWVHLLKEDSHKVLFVRFATKDNEIKKEDDLWRSCIADVQFTEVSELMK